jgi:hypothetical protein
MKSRNKEKWCVEKLKQEGTRKQFYEKVNRIIQLKPIEKQENYKNTWKRFKEAITNTADKIIRNNKEQFNKAVD